MVIIDLKNNLFIRKNNEYEFTLDINNKKIDYTLKTNNIIMYQENVVSNLLVKDNIIKLSYNFDGLKKIIITLD